MTPSLNPYQPVLPDEGVSSDHSRLVFDGTIELADYAQLLPNRSLIRIAGGIVAALLIASSVVAAVIAFFTARRGLWPLSGVATLACLLILVLVLYVIVHLDVRQIARSRVRWHPELLGRIKGEVTEEGLQFSDGVHDLWLAPAQLTATNVLRRGLRVYLTAEPEHFLPLTVRLFDDYNVGVARNLLQRWTWLAQPRSGRLLAEPSRDDRERDDELVVPSSLTSLLVEEQPAKSIRFAGAISLEESFRTPALRQRAVTELISSLIVLLPLSLLLPTLDHWSIGLAAVGMIVAFSFNIRTWWSYFFGVQQRTWRQIGWVSPARFFVCTDFGSLRMPIAALKDRQLQEGRMVLQTVRGGEYFLDRDHFESPGDWQTAIEWIMRKPIKNQNETADVSDG